MAQRLAILNHANEVSFSAPRLCTETVHGIAARQAVGLRASILELEPLKLVCASKMPSPRPRSPYLVTRLQNDCRTGVVISVSDERTK